MCANLLYMQSCTVTAKMMCMKLRRFIEYSMAGSAVPVSVTTTDSPGCGRHTAAGASSRCHRASSIHCTSRSTENDRIYIESSWSTVINSRLSRSWSVYGKKKHECYLCRLGASKQKIKTIMRNLLMLHSNKK